MPKKPKPELELTPEEEKIVEAPIINTKLPAYTEFDKEVFFKAILSEQPFKKEYGLFDGAIKVIFKSLTLEQHNKVYNQVTEDEKQGVAKNNDQYLSQVILYRMGLSIDAINGTPFTDLLNSGDTVTKRKAVFDNWSTVKVSAFLDVFNEFQEVVTELTKKAKDQNFWIANG